MSGALGLSRAPEVVSRVSLEPPFRSYEFTLKISDKTRCRIHIRMHRSISGEQGSVPGLLVQAQKGTQLPTCRAPVASLVSYGLVLRPTISQSAVERVKVAR